jgi:toxin CcdB
MPQFDVYVNPLANQRDEYPFVVDVQHEHLSTGATRLVMPLMLASPRATSMRLAPLVRLNSKSFHVVALLTGPVRAKALQQRVGNLGDHRDAIIGAMDVILTGS